MIIKLYERHKTLLKNKKVLELKLSTQILHDMIFLNSCQFLAKVLA